MHFTSERQTPITFLFVNENIKCGYAFAYLEHNEYFGTKICLGFLKHFVFAFSAPTFSIGETLHVAYNKYKINKILFFCKYQIYLIECVYSPKKLQQTIYNFLNINYLKNSQR